MYKKYALKGGIIALCLYAVVVGTSLLGGDSGFFPSWFVATLPGFYLLEGIAGIFPIEEFIYDQGLFIVSVIILSLIVCFFIGSIFGWLYFYGINNRNKVL